MKYLIVKIYDHDCPICAETSEYDERIVEELGMIFRGFNLEEVIFSLRNPTTSFLNTVAWRVKASCLEEDGSITLPLYLIYREDTESFQSVLGDFENADEFEQQLEKLL